MPPKDNQVSQSFQDKQGKNPAKKLFDEGLMFKMSAIHQTSQAKNIPYQPRLVDQTHIQPTHQHRKKTVFSKLVFLVIKSTVETIANH